MLIGLNIEELLRVCISGLLDGPLMVVKPENGLPFSSTSKNRIKNFYPKYSISKQIGLYLDAVGSDAGTGDLRRLSCR